MGLASLSFNIRALRDHDGIIQGATNCFQDIAAHRAMAEEVRRKSADLEDLFDNSAIGLHIVGGDGGTKGATSWFHFGMPPRRPDRQAATSISKYNLN
ncbi:hypothetical protein LCM4573_16925 [Rhizobium sp. LCM 4573]|nr:hypothetical protein LCM4573_16925 [Rhizobium sp. LCM 4573]